MGKQIQLYLLPEDAENFATRVRTLLGVHLFSLRYSDPEHRTAESPVITIEGVSRISCLLAQSNRTELIARYVENQQHWVVNTLFSEVVEFSGCHWDHYSLKPGRLFFDQGFYDEAGQWRDKSEVFLEWANAVIDTAVKLFRNETSTDSYIGPSADKWRAAGGTFVSL
jgi:hypothetical protein